MDFNLLSVPLVQGLSQAQIEKEALRFLLKASPKCLETSQATPLLEIFENKMDLFSYQVLVGKSVKGLGGFTNITHRYVQLSLATYKGLEKDDARARFTLAHEFGHVQLHSAHKAVVFAKRSQLRAFEDPEWQANAFGAALLMPQNTMRILYMTGRMTTEEVMSRYKVSWSAAIRRVRALEKIFKQENSYEVDQCVF